MPSGTYRYLVVLFTCCIVGNFLMLVQHSLAPLHEGHVNHVVCEGCTSRWRREQLGRGRCQGLVTHAGVTSLVHVTDTVWAIISDYLL